MILKTFVAFWLLFVTAAADEARELPTVRVISNEFQVISGVVTNRLVDGAKRAEPQTETTEPYSESKQAAMVAHDMLMWCQHVDHHIRVWLTGQYQTVRVFDEAYRRCRPVVSVVSRSTRGRPLSYSVTLDFPYPQKGPRLLKLIPLRTVHTNTAVYSGFVRELGVITTTPHYIDVARESFEYRKNGFCHGFISSSSSKAKTREQIELEHIAADYAQETSLLLQTANDTFLKIVKVSFRLWTQNYEAYGAAPAFSQGVIQEIIHFYEARSALN